MFYRVKGLCSCSFPRKLLHRTFSLNQLVMNKYKNIDVSTSTPGLHHPDEDQGYWTFRPFIRMMKTRGTGRNIDVFVFIHHKLI